jgi:hypothetical protein
MGLDQRAIDKIGGPAWTPIRPLFNSIVSGLLGVSDTSRGELTTIYIKFTADETGSQPYAIVWLRKSSQLTIGLSLPEDTEHPAFSPMPKGCKYAGISKYFELTSDDRKPDGFDDLASEAIKNVIRIFN